MKYGIKNFLSLVAGVAMAWLAGLILWPLMLLALDNFLHFDFSGSNKGMTKDDLILLVVFMLWFFIATGCGGIVASLLQPQKINLLLCSLCQVTILALILGVGELFDTSAPEPWLLLAMIPTGYFTGGWLGRKFKGNYSTNSDDARV